MGGDGPGSAGIDCPPEPLKVSPGWASTNLGQALVAAAEAIEDDEANDGQQATGPRRVVLVSDLQQGSNLEALLAYEWPQRTELVVKTIPCAGHDQRVPAIGGEPRSSGLCPSE